MLSREDKFFSIPIIDWEIELLKKLELESRSPQFLDQLHLVDNAACRVL